MTDPVMTGRSIDPPTKFLPNTAEQELQQLIDEMRAAGMNSALGVLGSGAISPHTLIALLRHTMSDLDGKIEFLTNKIYSTTGESKAMQQRQSKLHELNTALTNAESDSGAELKLEQVEMKDGSSAADFIDQHALDDFVQFSDKGLAGKWTTQRLVRLAEDNDGVLTDKAFDNWVSATKGGITQASAQEAKRIGLDFGSDGEMSVDELTKATTDWQVSVARDTGSLHMSRDVLHSAIGELESQQAALSGNRELDMIQLQSYMQERSQAITLTTNAIKSIDDSERSIVNNLR